MTALQHRLFDCIPLVEYGLEAFLRILEVQETESVPTAAVPLGKSPRLLLNPKFVAASCPDDADLAVLVLHELHHVLLGHTRLFTRVTDIDNLAFDAVINAMICRRLPHPRFHAFFKRIYRADRFPECLLRPPDGAHADPAVNRLLRELYAGDQGTYHDVYQLLRQRLATVSLPMLLGSHGADGRGLEVGDDPALFAAVRAIAERWPQPPDPRVGRSFDQVLKEFVVPTAPSPHQAVLRRALLAAARPGAVPAGIPDVPIVRLDAAGPSRDRRGFALAAAGTAPLLWRHDLPGRRRPAGQAPVDVYIDVSGSCEAFIPALYAAVLACRSLVAPRVFTFSVDVQPLSMADLAVGRVRTRQGTDGAAVSAHLRQRHCRAAVMLTDGFVGRVPPGDVAACRAARLQVILTPGGFLSDLAPAALAVHQLEQP